MQGGVFELPGRDHRSRPGLSASDKRRYLSGSILRWRPDRVRPASQSSGKRVGPGAAPPLAPALGVTRTGGASPLPVSPAGRASRERWPCRRSRYSLACQWPPGWPLEARVVAARGRAARRGSFGGWPKRGDCNKGLKGQKARNPPNLRSPSDAVHALKPRGHLTKAIRTRLGTLPRRASEMSGFARELRVRPDRLPARIRLASVTPSAGPWFQCWRKSTAGAAGSAANSCR